MADARAIDDAGAPRPETGSGRKATIGNRLEYLIACGLLSASRAVGVDRASAIGGFIARSIGPFLPETRRADENLKAIFPDWDEQRRRAVIMKVWDNLGRTAGEFAHLDAFDPAAADSRVEIVGAENVFEAAGNGPVIFVSGHFANWEIMAVLLQYSGIKFAILYRAANNPLTDELIVRSRSKIMSRLQAPKGNQGARAMLDMMADGVSLAMLVDQKQNAGVTVPFLGREAKTATTAARLALRFKAPIVPASVERLEGAHFRVRALKPIYAEPTGDFSADVVKITREINDAIGAEILARPEQWLWLHRRWPKE